MTSQITWLDLNAICSRYRYRYPIPDTRCRYLARCSFFHSSICLSGSFSSSSSSLLPRNGSSCCFILCHFWTSEETFRALDESKEVPTLEDCGKKKESNMDKTLTIIKQHLWERFWRTGVFAANGTKHRVIIISPPFLRFHLHFPTREMLFIRP